MNVWLVVRQEEGIYNTVVAVFDSEEKAYVYTTEANWDAAEECEDTFYKIKRFEVE